MKVMANGLHGKMAAEVASCIPVEPENFEIGGNQSDMKLLMFLKGNKNCYLN